MVSPFLPDADKLAAVRAALPAVEAGIYLNTGSAGPLPAETVAAMREIEDRLLRTGRGHHRDWEDTAERVAEARAAVAAILGAPLNAVALTHSTSDGMNAVAWGIDWRPGDRVVTTNEEHPGGLGPLVQLRDRLGVELVIADIGGGADEAQVLHALDAAIRPGTRLVALSHVLWTTGAVLPVARIAELAHDRGALVLIDGAQAAGAIAVDVAALGIDAYAAAGQKWLLGPEGMGALYVAPGSADRIRPTFAGWGVFEALDRATGAATTWPDARRFDWTNFHWPSITGFARSCGWLSMFVGLDWLHGRAAALARTAVGRLAAIDGVTVLTPPSMATLVTFEIAGWPGDAAAEELGSRVFAILRSVPGREAVRISVAAFNTEAEIERLAGAVELLAAHTPETLPPRRLAVLGQGS